MYNTEKGDVDGRDIKQDLSQHIVEILLLVFYLLFHLFSRLAVPVVHHRLFLSVNPSKSWSFSLPLHQYQLTDYINNF